MRFLSTITILLAIHSIAFADIKSDESVILFPTSAHLSEDGKQWVIPIHGWIYEPEDDSAWRSAAIEKLIKEMEFNPKAVENETFRRRARMFIVDNERGKELQVQIGTTKYDLKESAENGHFYDTVRIDRENADKLARDGMLRVDVVTRQKDNRQFKQLVKLVGPRGVSVISDIDDTIKNSHVLDKKKLAAKTFLLPFKSVDGMPDAYQHWQSKEVVFHYVSSSPWQLFPTIDGWTRHENLPRGSFHLKKFRVKDSSFLKLFASPIETKPPLIMGIMKRYPNRKFILVGDSGERDAEVYGLIYSKRPKQVHHIFIRHVNGADNTPARFKAAFKSVPANQWTVFTNPGNLKKLDLPNATSLKK